MVEDRIIYFDEELHAYTDQYRKPYISATTIAGKYVEKDDFEATAAACERIGKNPKHPKYAKYKGKTKWQLLEEWKVITVKALHKGKTKHSFLECNINDNNNYNYIKSKLLPKQLYTISHIIHDHTFGAINLNMFAKSGIKDKYPSIYKLIEVLTNVGYYFYSEIGVYNPNYYTCGCIDLLAINFVTGNFIIIDWKTNADPIVFEAGYFDKDINGNRTENFIAKPESYFKYPIAYLPASTGNKYAIQLSNYAWHVEQFGFKCEAIILYHIRDIVTNKFLSITQEKVIDIAMPYYKKEIQSIVDDYKSKVILDKNKQINLF